MKEINQKCKSDDLALFALDFTTITLTIKLLWNQGIHHVKLFSGINLMNYDLHEVSLHFGKNYDSKYGNKTVESIPANAVGIMDRGFSSHDKIRELCKKKKYFIVTMKNNETFKILEESQFCLGAKESVSGIRIIAFCNGEKKSEYRLATNLPLSGERGITNE
jgi:putative transposase